MGNLIETEFNPSPEQLEAKKHTQQCYDLTDKLNFETVYSYETRKVLYNYFMQTVSKFRIKIYKKMAFSPEYNKWIHYYTKKDVVTWINLFGWTYDPIRMSGQATPFVCYGYHRDYLYACRKYKHTITIKPRGTGYTWVKAMDKVFRFLNDESYQCAIVSRVFDDIDKAGDRHQTVMGRMRFAMSSLPFFDLSELDTDNEGFLQYGSNSIRAYTSNPDALRSGRSTELDIEEAGAILSFTAVMASAVSVSDEIRIGGTVKGTSSGFYDFWKNKDSEYFHIFWRHDQHPLMSTPDWERLEKMKYNNDDRLFRQEVLGDFWAMVGESVLIDLDRDKHAVSLNQLSYHRMKKGVSIDPGAGSSPTSIWFFYFDNFTDTWYFTDYSELHRTTHEKVVAEIEAKGFGNDTVYLMDSAGRNITPTGESWYSLLTSGGLTPLFLVNNKNITGSVLMANQNLRDSKIFFDQDSTDVMKGFSRLSRYVFTDRYGVSKVKKDENSDAGDSFRYAMAFPYALPKASNRIIKLSERSQLNHNLLTNRSKESNNSNIMLFSKG